MLEEVKITTGHGVRQETITVPLQDQITFYFKMLWTRSPCVLQKADADSARFFFLVVNLGNPNQINIYCRLSCLLAQPENSRRSSVVLTTWCETLEASSLVPCGKCKFKEDRGKKEERQLLLGQTSYLDSHLCSKYLRGDKTGPGPRSPSPACC